MITSLRSGPRGFVACWAIGVALIFVVPAAADKPEIERLRGEMRALRTQLAQAKLELQKTVNELQLVRRFVASENAAADIARWKAARLELEKERNQLAIERRKMTQAKAALQDAARVGSFAQQQALEQSPAERAAQPRWEVDYKIAPIQGAEQGETIYFDPVGGDVLLERYPNIDRKNIMVRGTFQNTSSEPWRYTFEIRIGDKFGRIIGRWKHQTPMLTTQQLHDFEIKVPVSDVGYIHSYQIGNIVADRPAAAAAVDDAARGQPDPAANRPAPVKPKPQPAPKLRIRPDGRAY